MDNFEIRVEKLRTLLIQRSLHAIVLRRNPNLAWAIAGRAHVPSTIDAACFDLIVTLDSVTAVTNSIEAPRLIAEEFPSGIDVKIINWWEGRDSLLPTGEKIGSDQAGAGRIDMSSEVELIRSSLIASDVVRFRNICSDAAVALGAAMKEVKNSDREIDVAGRISKALWESDLEIAFLGVAGESRVKKFRHPLPTHELVGSRVVASICAKRKGLIASVTRIATFGELPESDFNSYLALLHVEGALLDATVVGMPFSDPVDAAIAAYPANGFDTDEWTRHHQGGPTGYLPRDWPATTTTTRVIAQNQPIAWNPTAQGWKAEDTILASARGIEILSVDSAWPELEVAGRKRPSLLQR
jgi:antitoxin VapB